MKPKEREKRRQRETEMKGGRESALGCEEAGKEEGREAGKETSSTKTGLAALLAVSLATARCWLPNKIDTPIIPSSERRGMAPSLCIQRPNAILEHVHPCLCLCSTHTHPTHTDADRHTHTDTHTETHTINYTH